MPDGQRPDGGDQASDFIAPRAPPRSASFATHAARRVVRESLLNPNGLKPDEFRERAGSCAWQILPMISDYAAHHVTWTLLHHLLSAYR
jgi:hypothetical protein